MPMENALFDRFLYGGDYSPEQWSEDSWPSDLDLFAAAGVNTLTLPVFSWANVQPAQDRYDFDWLDRFLDLASQRGFSIVLATPTAAQPAWMSAGYPDVLPVDAAGRKRTHGARRNFCPNSVSYRKFSANIASRMARHFGGRPEVILWHVSNEYRGVCYCERCASGFAGWLETRYGTIEALNERLSLDFWGNRVTAWDEVPVPTALNDGCVANQAVPLNYRRFQNESLIACYRNEYDAIREYCPETPITSNFTGVLESTDFRSWAPYLDIIGWDNYPVGGEHWSEAAFRHDIMRGLKRKSFLVTEQSPSQQNWLPYNTLREPGRYRLLSYQAIAHGADSILMFQLKASRGGFEKYHGAVVSHAGHCDTRIYRECATVGTEISKTGKRIIYAMPRNEVALIFDWNSWWALSLSSGPSIDLDYYRHVAGLYRTLSEMHTGVDVLPADADLSAYRTVFAPLLYSLDEPVADALSEYVSAGGVLVSGFLSGGVDIDDRVFEGGRPGPLRELFGLWVEEIDALIPGDSVCVEAEFDIAGGCPEAAYSASLLCERVRVENASVLARYDGKFYTGEPCLTRNRYGKGAAYYLAADFDRGFVAGFVKWLYGSVGVRTAPEIPSDIEYASRTGRDGTYHFYLNHGIESYGLGVNPATCELLIGSVSGYGVALGPGDIVVIRTGETRFVGDFSVYPA